jgi:hypothetical protein
MLDAMSLNRMLAGGTLGVLALALVVPTHELGDAAVYGSAYLWGESSSRVNVGREIVWFVDLWEVAQHVLFAMATITCVATIISGRRIALVALALGGLIGLALQRSFSGGGVMVAPSFLVIVIWTLTVSVAPRMVRQQGR